MSGLLELAERCEQATAEQMSFTMKDAGNAIYGYGSDADECRRFFRFISNGAFLDAAMTLVPEGYQFGCGSFGNPDSDGPWAWCEPEERLTDDFPYGRGNTPALALCAAALRATDAGKEGR
jgi:hypothetical protein